MIKLKNLSVDIINKHLNWCNNKIKPRLEKINNLENNQIFKEFLNSFDELIKSKNLKTLKEKYKDLYELCNEEEKNKIKEIFNYKKFSSNGNKEWNRHMFLSELSMTTCPYCGRQYITNYSDNKSTADLDHFYSKSKYPYLALNIYNFIPSCQICNRNLKKDQDIGLYPFEEEFGDDAIFKIKFLKNTQIIPRDEKDFIIELFVRPDSEKYEKIKKNKNVFKLDEIYKKSHNKYIKNMLETFEIYSDEYFEVIDNLFENTNQLNYMKKMLKKQYLFKIKNEEPLGKLTKDILKNYGILREDE